jgi:hypothetical protein|tara:strand:+ start:828 stop:1070 length:243 start_codon:yes stop_codon:yes gene_type:complete
MIDWSSEKITQEMVDASLKTPMYDAPIKPLYMLIKVEVDSGIVYNQEQAEKYAENHCNSLEYALCDWYYPDEPQFPYIAK